MKITLPLPHTHVVGYKTGFIEYYDAEMRFVGEVEIDKTLTEVRLTPTVVFDHDFKALRRAHALGHLVHATAHLAVVMPLAVVYVVGEKVGEGIQFVAEKLNDLLRAHGVPSRYGIRQTYKAMLTEIVAPA